MNAVRIRAVLVAILVCAVVATPVAGATGTYEPVDGSASVAGAPSADPATVATSATGGQSSTLQLTQQLQLTPERPGEIAVTVTYGVPDRVTKLSTEVPADATVLETRGFRRDEGTRYAWTGGITRPAVTYRLPANVTTQGTGPLGSGGDYRFADAGPWALVRVPPTATSWSWTGTPRVSLARETTTAGPGAVGEAVAFLGEHRTYAHEAHGQRFRLVVPEAAALRESPDDVFAALAHASGALRVGDRDETVFLVAAPTDVPWGVRGIQSGDADGWVRADERLDDQTNVWVHEYVHTRQSWETTEATRWTTEATATYYAVLLALERGAVGYNEFQRQLEAGTYSPQAGAVLADPSTWRNAANYQKGALVAAELDRRIRLATDGRRSLQHVLRRMNEQGDPVTAETFRRLIADAADGSVSEAAARYTTTADAPSAWDRTAHAEAFGPSPAYVEYELDGRHAVAGPYRNGTLDGRSLTLVPGETLTVAAAVSNTGGSADDYEATFRVDGEPAGTATGRVEPGARESLSFSHTFAGTGSHTVAVGDSTLDVEVVRPAGATVTDVSVDRSTVPPGEQVRLTSTVTNEATVPGETTVAFRVDGRTVATREVRLGPGETRTATATTTFDAPGTYRVDAGGDATSTVTVEATPTPVASGGFGALVALTALAFLVVVGRRR